MEHEKTRDIKTESRYRHLAQKLLFRFERETGVLWEDDPERLLMWLSDYTGWSKSTWRQYRSALVYFMREQGNDNLSDHIKQVDNPHCKTFGQKGPAKKMKKMSNTMLLKITHEVLVGRMSRSDFSKPLAIWLHAGLMTGLRPSEWRTAKLAYADDDKHAMLIVKNGKNSNGRACGHYRTLHFFQYSPDEIKIIQLMIDNVRTFGYDALYTGCSKLLYRVSCALWPDMDKRPSLYSTRHQFSADYKGIGMSKEVLAALMGHRSSETATMHYQKKSGGRQKRSVSNGVLVADPYNLSQVKSKQSNQANDTDNANNTQKVHLSMLSVIEN